MSNRYDENGWEILDTEDCILCGRPVSRVQSAYYEDDDTNEMWHLDCDDPNGAGFGDDGMPLHDTDGTCEIDRRAG